MLNFVVHLLIKIKTKGFAVKNYKILYITLLHYSFYADILYVLTCVWLLSLTFFGSTVCFALEKCKIRLNHEM